VWELGQPGCRCGTATEPRWPGRSCPLPTHRLVGQYLHELQEAAAAAGEVADTLADDQVVLASDRAQQAWPIGLGPCGCDAELGLDACCPIAAHARIGRWYARQHQRALHAAHGLGLDAQLDELLDRGRREGFLDAVAFLQACRDQRHRQGR
jgi:hypothetical protein